MRRRNGTGFKDPRVPGAEELHEDRNTSRPLGLSQSREDAEGSNKSFRKQTLGSLTPRLLGPFSSTKLEKNQI